MHGDTLTAIGLKAVAILGGIAYVGWTIIAQVAQQTPVEAIPEVAKTATVTGIVVGILYWAINRIDRMYREDREAREEEERQREARWMAHDTKREETLRQMQESCHAQHRDVLDTVKAIADKTGVALDRNSEALVRTDATLRRCEERHSRENKGTA